MGTLSNELSSWRKNIVECPAGDVTTLNFRDTRPNVMLVMNPTEHKILCNLDSIPTEDHYDFTIKNHYARLVGKPVATSQVYFLNTGNESVTLQVYSIFDKNFDPSWLSDFSIENVNIDSESVKPIVDAIKGNTQVEVTGYTGTDKIPVTDTLILERLNALLSDNPPANGKNIKNVVTRLEYLTGQSVPPTGAINLKNLYNTLNGDTLLAGSNFGQVLLNDEEPVEGYLGLWNIAQKLDAIATKLDTLIAK